MTQLIKRKIVKQYKNETNKHFKDRVTEINTFITPKVANAWLRRLNDDSIPDGVYFIVNYDGENIEVIEKHIRL